MKKRILSAALALLLFANLPLTALAEEYDLADGSIEVSASDDGSQYVSQTGVVSNEKQTTATVIFQTGSDTTTTTNTVTVSTTGDAVAEFTIRDVNISTSGDAIDVGDSNVEITLEGENKVFSESGSAVHVSGGDVVITGSGSLEAEIGDNNNYDNENAKIGSHEGEEMSGNIHITGNATVTMKDDRDDDNSGYGAGIGSGYNGEMSGNITIGDNANVDVFSQDDGAGIGSGRSGKMSGSITIGGNALVTAGSGYDGAGIGSGENGNMSGHITIDDNAQVTAWGEHDGPGIGAGEDGNMSGTIVIGGSAQVTAGNDNDGAGIGAGEKGSISPIGRIIIRDNAKVTAIGEDEGTGIGAGENRPMGGLIIIQDNAQVTAIAGGDAASIGSNNENTMTGTILILGNACVTTGVLDGDDVWFDYDAKEIKYTLDEDAIGYIGGGQDSHHESNEGHYVIGPNVTINGVKGSDTEALKDYVNMRLNDSGEPENLTQLDIKAENGEFTATAEGEGSVEKVLYDGEESVPTEPGEYPATLALKLDEETTIEFEIGTLVIPEPEPEPTPEPAEDEIEADPPSAPLYRVLGKDKRSSAYKAEKKGSVLTITVDADFAVLTGKLSGISTLKAQGVEKIIFVTTGATSTFATADLLKQGAWGETYCLTHDGSTITFTLGEPPIDVSSILEKT